MEKILEALDDAIEKLEQFKSTGKTAFIQGAESKILLARQEATKVLELLTSGPKETKS